MPESLCHECYLILSLQRVHEYLIGLGSESHHPSSWGHLNRQHFVRIIDLRHRHLLIAVPEEDGCALAASHKLKLIIFPLSHAVEGPILSLMPIHPLLLFQIVS